MFVLCVDIRQESPSDESINVHQKALPQVPRDQAAWARDDHLQ
jgi:hypothetical protein